MKKLKKIIVACPLMVCLLCSWGVVAGAKYLPQLSEKIDQTKQQEDAADWLTDETQELTANDAVGGTIGANRAPDLSEQAIMEADGHDASAQEPPVSDENSEPEAGSESGH